MALSDSNNWIRIRVLEELYDVYHKAPGEYGLDRATLLKHLKVSEELLDANILYLEEKKLIELLKTSGSIFENAMITAYGIDVIERKGEYGHEFPFLNINVQQIKGNVYGQAIQAIQSNLEATQNISNSFKKARDIINDDGELSPEIKKEANDQIDILEEESKKETPDAGTVQRSWEWLKRNASIIIPILVDSVKYMIDKILGSHA